MPLILDSFWRAALYCVRPRVIVLSLLPLVLMVALSMGLGYFYWDAALDLVRGWLESFSGINLVWQWLDSVGVGRLKSVLAPLLVVLGVTPVIVVVCMLCVAQLMTPALVTLVADNRFPDLEAREGANWSTSLAWALFSSLLAGMAMLMSVPLWLLPPLVLLLPPLIWGWLTYRVMAFDAMARHASKEERSALFKRHSGSLLLMGVIAGYLGASPSAVWALGTGYAPAFIFLVPLAIWIYTLVFAFAALWFVHYCLAALQALRAEVPSRFAGDTVDMPTATHSAAALAPASPAPPIWKDAE